MKIEKLPSGSYRIRKMYKGETYSLVFDHKPTQKEALQAIAAELDKVKTKYDRLTFFRSNCRVCRNETECAFASDDKRLCRNAKEASGMVSKPPTV